MADDKGKEEAPKKKGKGKLLIIIIAVVVLVVAGVAVKMFVFGGKKEQPAQQKTEQQAQENENQNEGNMGEQNLEPVVVGPIIVNLADAGGDRYLKIKLVLLEAKQKAKEEKKEETKTGISLEDAVIKNAIIVTTSAKTSDDLLSVSGKEELKSELIAAINRALHKNLVKKIFFTEFIIQ